MLCFLPNFDETSFFESYDLRKFYCVVLRIAELSIVEHCSEDACSDDSWKILKLELMRSNWELNRKDCRGFFLRASMALRS